LTIAAVCPKTDNQQSLIWSPVPAMGRTPPNSAANRSANLVPIPADARICSGLPSCLSAIIATALLVLAPMIPAQPGADAAASKQARSAAEANADEDSRTAAILDPMAPHDRPRPNDMVPRWLEAVRAQRRALQEHRRAQHQARRRAIDPVGTARQEAFEQEVSRRRQEMREMIAEERWLFLNFGPWATPWPVAPELTPGRVGSPPQPRIDPDQEPQVTSDVLPDWDNGWYFRGW
jgi:hypothetical protein